MGDGFVDGSAQFERFDRFVEEIDGAAAKGVLHDGAGAFAGQKDGGKSGVALANPGEQIEAGSFGHPIVCQNTIEVIQPPGGKNALGVVGPLGVDGGEPPAREQPNQELAADAVIFDDQQS